MSSPKDELADLRRFLLALQSGATTIHENGADVTKREIDRLKPDIEYLESLLLPGEFPNQINAELRRR
jgi:hypothetical protein